jgi:hypothetical protein
MEGSDVDPVHAGPPGPLDAEITVFPDNAPLRSGVEPAGRLKKRIGLRLVAVGVFAGDDRVEAVGDPDPLENLPADVAVAAGHDGQRHPPAAAANDGDHRVDRLDRMELVKEALLLAMGFPLHIDRHARLGGQRGHDVAGGPAPHGIEAVFVEGHAVGIGHHPPGPVVGRHRVGEGAVAIEENGVELLERPHRLRPLGAGCGGRAAAGRAVWTGCRGFSTARPKGRGSRG